MEDILGIITIASTMAVVLAYYYWGRPKFYKWWSPLLKRRKVDTPIEKRRTKIATWIAEIDQCFEDPDMNAVRDSPEVVEVLEWFLKESGFKTESLIPINDDEYDRIVFSLKERVKKDLLQEMLDGHLDNDLHDLYFWKEVVLSMRMRIRDAYYIKDIQCQCGNNKTILLRHRSNEDTWRNLHGREGYILICPECLSHYGAWWYCIS